MKTTVKNEIDLIEQVYTGHKIPKDTLARWLSDVDASVARQILLVEDFNHEYSYTESPDTELLVSEAPWRRIYFLYLSAMIDFVLKQYNTYANELAEYNNAIADYKHYIVTNYNPASKNTAERERYYVSPYTLAVKHGFAGTEEEWVQQWSLSDPVTFEVAFDDGLTAAGSIQRQGAVIYLVMTVNASYGSVIQNSSAVCQVDMECSEASSGGIAIYGVDSAMSYLGTINVSVTLRSGELTVSLSSEASVCLTNEKTTITMVLLPHKGDR